ncbi:diaminopropionate ammonia-lyase [Paenarthrobacter nicotinovorans]|uniref:diaminopropionate ammonia-lyase n=1 Tax=Paenarthrobacter nicotinovorans TaxID=29320 RepID=UPI003D667B2E
MTTPGTTLPATTDRSAVPNPHADPSRIHSGKGDGVLEYHRTLPGYAATPLVTAPSIAQRLGVASVHIKDESSRLGMPSFKILGASWATYRALTEMLGLNHREVHGISDLAARLSGHDLTLVAATDGNHGRAVARMAKSLGQSAHILVPSDMVAERIEAIRDEGATVTVVNGNYDVAVAASAALADDTHVVISDTSWEGYEQVPGWVIDGYRTIVDEVLQTLSESGNEPPTIVVAQMGVGAFATAMIRGFSPLGARIIGSEPTKAACVLESIRLGHCVQLDGALDSIMAGLNCGTPSPLAWPDLLAGLNYVAAVTDDDAREAMRELATVGVVSGESGAAGLAALLAHGPALGLSASDRILVVSTEGATDRDAYQRIVGITPDAVRAEA